MSFLREHWYIPAGIVIAVIIAVLAWLFPGSREIDVTLQATEYCLSDPNYAIEHTVTIKGRDSRNRFGKGNFQGTISVNGLVGMESETEVMASLGDHPFTTGGFREQNIPLNAFVPNWDYTTFVAMISEELPDGVRVTGGADVRFIVSGVHDYETAIALAAELYHGTYWEDTFSTATVTPNGKMHF